MAIAAFPPIGFETWTEVATSSPTSGSSVTLSSLPAASKLRIVGFNLTASSSAGLGLTINNDTTTSYTYAYDTTGDTTNSEISLGVTATRFSFVLTFDPANQAIYKNGIGFSANTSDTRNNFNVLWANTAVIDRFDLTLSAGTFTAGTIKVFAA